MPRRKKERKKSQDNLSHSLPHAYQPLSSPVSFHYFCILIFLILSGSNSCSPQTLTSLVLYLKTLSQYLVLKMQYKN